MDLSVKGFAHHLMIVIHAKLTSRTAHFCALKMHMQRKWLWWVGTVRSAV